MVGDAAVDTLEIPEGTPRPRRMTFRRSRARGWNFRRRRMAGARSAIPLRSNMRVSSLWVACARRRNREHHSSMASTFRSRALPRSPRAIPNSSKDGLSGNSRDGGGRSGITRRSSGRDRATLADGPEDRLAAEANRSARVSWRPGKSEVHVRTGRKRSSSSRR